ncbi:tRNA (cytosine(32)/uridine(32)-2'-O)-methyltransferase TrmJ [Thalassotalea psychrophila]|uniref:tRNA (cytidine/uridine-2'-O-)-methyltransferase TrmJ n=1 Tax=Thalassotalea psychrophila TaxID=3065647 RepID=A0ABY9TRS5_9GAMM|nr:tRNA (cytosine(32)/uridine(32)-2'-O)-methyltransferase TrmJ [Colwelliaceae bacterium SQ149]
MLDNVRIVLVNTSDCRNIGSAARAMKTMGLKNLVLVDPKEMPNGQAQALAAGATDVLANAKVVATMKEAIEDCGLVVGTSARSRTLPWPMLDPRGCGKQMAQEGKEYPVALVFGRESSGLTNDELQLCHYHVAIPANPEYSSLNLAMAVQTLSYEIRMNFLEAEQAQFDKKEIASDSNDSELQEESKYQLVEETERFYDHFESAMQSTGFIQAKHPGIIMTKVRRLFNRARPDGKELKMLRGILASIDKSVKNKD